MYSLPYRVFMKVKSRNAHMKTHRPIDPKPPPTYTHYDENG